jgi:hypothetical protein
LIGGVAFGNATEIEKESGLSEVEGVVADLEMLPSDRRESFLEAVGRGEFLTLASAAPESGELADGRIEGAVGIGGEFER